MFSRIAGTYDLLNRVLSLGIDRRWRRRAADLALETGTGETVLDLCCGTGDLALELRGRGTPTVGIDFTLPMLARAPGKVRSCHAGGLFIQGDALAIPLGSDSVGACTVAFGIRNVAAPERCLAEMARVVRPGGRVVVLEFTVPGPGLLGWLYRVYFTGFLPLLGRLVSRDAGAYSYLPETVMAWPDARAFQAQFETAGLVDCGHRLLTGGIACLHWGTVLADAARGELGPVSGRPNPVGR
ncbi:MAG: dimethylmenaquinone methyltransferase [Planctomycetes bacterium]|jgi:demethylmenaquinone methyltransferase/2-methoxy-6-polyprenyl-1,4-benzoquinol methylase|nr:dimethylmenaquinone methyltransferase [Planctomycetota bacterium]